MNKLSCIKCNKEVDGFQKYCDKCVKKHNLIQNKKWHDGRSKFSYDPEIEFKRDVIQKPKKEKKNLKLGEQLDFNSLFRVRGHKGLFIIGSTVNKSGLIKMYSFLNKEKGIITKSNNLSCLGQLVFFDYSKEGKTISDVFINCEDFIKKTKGKTVSEEKFMDMLLPNYDTERFKLYHAKQVVEWYNEALLKINNIVDEKPKETAQAS